MNRRQAFALAGLLTATVSTGSVAVIGLAHCTPLGRRCHSVSTRGRRGRDTGIDISTAAEEMDEWRVWATAGSVWALLGSRPC